MFGDSLPWHFLHNSDEGDDEDEDGDGGYDDECEYY